MVDTHGKRRLISLTPDSIPNKSTARLSLRKRHKISSNNAAPKLVDLKKNLKKKLTGIGLRAANRFGYYAEDGLISIHNHEFLDSEEFIKAYGRGLDSGGGIDPHHRWRVHTAIWAARSASSLAGDFVECGVNTGFISSAIMQTLQWNDLGKSFYLLDTFDGPNEAWFSEEEKSQGKVTDSHNARALGRYFSDVDAIRQNFSEWRSVNIIQGTVPETLEQVDTKSVAFLHIDMNQAYPELKALEFFWPVLVDGAIVLLDDYAYIGYTEQKRAMDSFADSTGVSILSLPTGQGLLIRPPTT